MYKVCENADSVVEILFNSQRLSTCNRGRVAAVIQPLHDFQSCVVGYSHSMTDETCDTDGHKLDDGGSHCVRTIHAEVMAIAKAASMGLSTRGATCYTTRLPCEACVRALRCANVRSVMVHETVIATEQEWADRIEYAKRVGIALSKCN